MNRDGELIAQVSIYPLKADDPAPLIDMAIRKWHEFGLNPVPGPMSTMISGEEGRIWEGLRMAFDSIPPSSDPVMVVIVRRKKGFISQP